MRGRTGAASGVNIAKGVTHRAAPGPVGPRASPRGPTRAPSEARHLLPRVGGWVSPPGDSLFGGGASEGGVQGGETKAGEARRALCPHSTQPTGWAGGDSVRRSRRGARRAHRRARPARRVTRRAPLKIRRAAGAAGATAAPLACRPRGRRDRRPRGARGQQPVEPFSEAPRWPPSGSRRARPRTRAQCSPSSDHCSARERPRACAHPPVGSPSTSYGNRLA